MAFSISSFSLLGIFKAFPLKSLSSVLAIMSFFGIAPIAFFFFSLNEPYFAVPLHAL